MPATNANTERMMRLMNRQTLIRLRDLRRLSIPHIYLTRFVEKGLLVKLHREIYKSAAKARELTEHQSLLEVFLTVPKAVVCLLSALQFHQIGIQLPHQL